MKLNLSFVSLEPVGRVSPKYPKSAKSDSFEVMSGSKYSLLCEAQAFPTPVFRWAFCWVAALPWL